MKESITKFDLEAAFKALDELDTPAAESGIKANRPALTEIFSRKTKFDALLEDYYDIGNMAELDDAKTAREAEVAQAKLARIEKIVDLDAESPEDLLPSYVGKFIIQCPQCMTLFYKSPEDVVESEEDTTVVNESEVCQHCGNDSGYTLIGKVGAATEEETQDVTDTQEFDVDSTSEEDAAVDTDVESEDDIPADEEDIDLDIELDGSELGGEEEEEPEKAEESHFVPHSGDALFEELTEATEDELSISENNFTKLLNSPEFKTPVSDAATRAMLKAMNKDDDEKPSLAEGAVDIYDDDDEYMLADNIDFMMYSGRLRNSRLWPDAPMVKEIGEGKFRVTRNSGATSVIVQFDMSNRKSSVLNFTVNGKAFTTNNIGEGQKIVLAELENAYKNQFNVSVDEKIQMHENKALKKKSTTQCTEAVNINNEQLKFAVIGADGTFIGEPCTTYEEAKELANMSSDTTIVELDEADLAKLNEGGLLSLGKSLIKGAGQKLKNLKNNISAAIDKLADNVKSREEKANWVLENAMEDYNKAQINDKGQLVTDAANKRFKTFVVIGFTDKYTNGKEISMAPSYDNKDLVPGMDKAKTATKYVDADNAAKGWSKMQGNGPAHIYLAKDAQDDKAVFLCQYFDGDVKDDQLETYFKAVKDHLEGAKLFADKTENSNAETETPTEQEQQQETAVTESLEIVMAGIDSLQEELLEEFISKSLQETYKNVNVFKLTDCSYLDEALYVNGIIEFKSGNTRNTTYVFTEAHVHDAAIELRGLNEKLGANKHFILTGSVANKTLITESFNYTNG